jgi:phosphoglycolate phosphatase
MTNLVLFDIDGTLVLTGGAGLRAMTRAIERVTGHADGLSGIAIAGRTDWIILTDALDRFGLTLENGMFERLRDEYVAMLAEEIAQRGEGRKDVMPGIRELLARLHARDDVWLGLLTGNFVEGARIKLEHFDLWKFFRCGAFGDDASDRNALVPVAVGRARERGLPDIAADAVFVVGDTPHDIACARAANAVPIGVATGGYTVEDLRETGAEIVFADLRDTDAFIALLR